MANVIDLLVRSRYGLLVILEQYKSNGKERRKSLQNKLRNRYNFSVTDQTITNLAKKLEDMQLIIITKEKKLTNYELTDKGKKIDELLDRIAHTLKN